MTLRDYFAAMALQGLLASLDESSNDGLASEAFDLADEMLNARECAP